MKSPKYRSSRFFAAAPAITTCSVVIALVFGVICGHLGVRIWFWIHQPVTSQAARNTVLGEFGIVHVPNEDDWSNVMDQLDRVLSKIASPTVTQHCKEMVHGRSSFTSSKIDTFTFRTFFHHLRQPGTYLEITDDPGRSQFHTLFLDVCLGWKGIRILVGNSTEKGPRSESVSMQSSLMEMMRYRSVKIIEACGGPDPNQCLSLGEIVRANQIILGPRDPDGHLATQLNYVAVNVEDQRTTASIMGCTDLYGLLSSQPRIQVWSISNKGMTSAQSRIVDAALTLAGLTKVVPVFTADRQFEEDVYVMMRGLVAKNSAHRPRAMKCPHGRASCPAADILSQIEMEGVRC